MRHGRAQSSGFSEQARRSRRGKAAADRSQELVFGRSSLRGSQNASTAVAGPRRLRRDRPDDPLEIGVRSRIAVDRNVLRDIELEPLDVVEQRDGVGVDVRQDCRPAAAANTGRR